MRVDRLHLKAFGPFRDRTLELRSDAPGVHLVYGDNEAGKSSALRALHAALFGISAKTVDAFQMDKSDLRVGADLRAGELTLSFLRRRRSKKMLWDLDDTTALPDDALEPFLHGLQAGHFRAFFGMGHEDLVAGGKMLARGETDLGTALFAAAGGIQYLAALLESLAKESGDLFKPTGKNPAINVAIKAFRDARKAERDLSLSSDVWEALCRELEQQREIRAATAAKLDTCTAQLERIQCFMRAAPVAAKRENVLDDIKALAGVPRLAEDFRERYQGAFLQRQSAAQSMADAQSDLDRINAEIAALNVDAAILNHQQEIEAFIERSSRLTVDLERCAKEAVPLIDQRDATLKVLVEKLGRAVTPDEAAELDVPENLADTITALSQEHAAHVQVRHAASENLARVEKSLKQLTVAPENETSAKDLAHLSALLDSLKPARDLEARVQEFAAEAAGIESTVTTRLKRLGHLEASISTLLDFCAPARATLAKHRDDQDAADQNAKQAAATLADARDEQARVSNRLRENQAVDAPPTEEELRDVRRDRDAAWQVLRGERHTIDEARAQELADALSAKIREADDMADRMRREAARVAEIGQLGVQLEQSARKVETAAARLEAATGHRETLQDAWRNLWAALDITNPGTPAEMLEWDQERSVLVTQAEKAKDLNTRVASLRIDGEAARQRIVTALPLDASPSSSLGEAFARLENRVRDARDKAVRQADRVSAIKQLENDDLPAARQRFAAANDALQQWQDSWQQAMTEIDALPEATPREGVGRVSLLRKIGNAARERQEARALLEQCAAEENSLRARVAELAARTGLDLIWESATQINGRLAEELESQRNAAATLVMRNTDIQKKTESFNQARTIHRDAMTKLDLYREEAGGVPLDQLPAVIAKADQARKLDERLDDLTDQLLGEASGVGLKDFLAEIDADPADTRADRCRELQHEQDELKETLQKHDTDIGRLDAELKALDGSDAAAKAREDAASSLAQLEENAATYMRIKLSEGLLRRAIEHYRDREQGPLLGHAGDLFAKVTLGKFAGLATDYVGDQPVLMGRRPGGSLVSLSGMSEGTADQLYLALRLAALERYFASHEPVPLVLDDLLVNFDDARAGVTLEILGELAQRTQIILFTHHKHLCELAQARLPKDQLHLSTLSETGA